MLPQSRKLGQFSNIILGMNNNKKKKCKKKRKEKGGGRNHKIGKLRCRGAEPQAFGKLTWKCGVTLEVSG